MKTIDFLRKQFKDAKKIVVYQNISGFSRPTLRYVSINPTHKVLVEGRRSRKKHSNKIDTSRNYEKIALVIRQYYGAYILSWYLTGVYLVCSKLSLL